MVAVKVIKPPPEATLFELTLTFEEAQVLHDLVGRVTGEEATTYRYITDTIYYALEEADERIYDKDGFVGEIEAAVRR